MFNSVRKTTGMFRSWFCWLYCAIFLRNEPSQDGVSSSSPSNGGTTGKNHLAGAIESPENGEAPEKNESAGIAQSSGNGGADEGRQSAETPQGTVQSDENNRAAEDTERETQPCEIGPRRWRSPPPPDTSNPKCPSLLRPKLICRKFPASRSYWEIFLSAHEECELKEVRLERGDQKLKISQNECRISSLDGNLIVKYGDGYDLSSPLFKGDKPLIFKFGKNWKGDGQRVSRITNGYFILIAPEDWKREGRIPVEQGNCEGSTFKVHFLNTTIPEEDFGSLGGWEIIPGPAIKLKGENIFDDSEEGELFTKSVPELEETSEILWARIGEERKHGWNGENFQPHKKSISEVLGNRKGKGRFFLRVYDHNVDMIDSVAFRYLDELRTIYIDDDKYTEDMVLIPDSNDGYLPTEIRFTGIDGRNIRPHLPNDSICKVTSSNALEVPPDRKADTVKCFLNSSGGKVTITLKLPRVWWQMRNPDDAKPGEWRATPFKMTQEKFKQHAKKRVKICLSSKKFKSVPVGFDNDSDRKRYKPSKIPLRDFIDHSEINDELKTENHLNIEWGGETLPIILVRPNPKPHYQIKACVKCVRHGCRRGRGFSPGEIKKAGFTVEEVRNQFIRVDGRRKSVHQTNVETIQKEINVQRN